MPEASAALDCVLGAALAVAVSALLTAGVIGLARDLFPMRRLLQQRWVDRWLHDAGAHTAAIRDVHALAAAGDPAALHTLSPDRLCRQLLRAGHEALRFPQRHEGVLRVLAAGASAEDLQAILGFEPPRAVPAEDSERARARRAAHRESVRRVRHHMRGRLELLAVSLQRDWQRTLLMASMIACASIVGVGLSLLPEPWPAVSSLPKLAWWAAVAALGGWAAPICDRKLAGRAPS